MTRRLLALLLFIILLPAPLRAQPAATGLKVPPGFEVTEYADSSLANDIYSMTVDPQGRIVVAGRGYIRILVDDDGDGRAERAIEFADGPKDGAMGLLWEGDTLYVTGDGGLRRFRDKDGNGKADGPSELVRAVKTGGEHTAHALRRGPDGWLYLLCGNTAGIDRSFAELPTSPVKEPIAGCVVHFTPDLKKSEVVAHGFRNPYGMDFNLDGELFTFDSDNERCVSLPWYEPTRLYHVWDGGFYGWLSPQRASFWRMPPYFCDVVAPVATLGRGSPTGVVCYRHTQFPARYRGGLFLCDWTFGKVYFTPLKRQGATYAAQPEAFLTSVGDNGFAPTAAVVHPQTGDLFLSIGGRGTRGAVYRVRYPEGLAKAKAAGEIKIMPRDHRAGGGPGALSLDVDRTGDPDTLKEAEGLLADWADPVGQLKGVRLLQRFLGDIGSPKAVGTIWEGYTPRKAGVALPLAGMLADRFPTGDRDLDREVTRTLAMLGHRDPGLLDRILATFGPESDPVEDIHYLAVFARLPGDRPAKATAKVAATLLDLDRKITQRKLNRDSNWPLRVAELYAALAEKDAKLHDAVAGHPQFGRPDHALFAQSEGFPRRRAAEVFLARIEHDADYPLTAAVVDVLGALPADRVVPTLRKLWGQTGQESAMLTLLARAPVAADRPKFVEGLAAAQPNGVRACLEGLGRLGLPPDGGETLALLLCLKRLPEGQKALRADALKRLQAVSGKAWAEGEPAWLDWFARAYPEQARRLTNPDGVDVAAWDKRLARLDWAAGDAGRGQKVFHKASCANCHSTGQAVGPDLSGVAGRFSRADLFTAILQPSRDVPVRYRVTVVETAGGKVYQGLVIYDAVDSLLLQTGPSNVVRVDVPTVVSRRVAAVSLMPAGLLDPLTDQEIADLYAYLRTLGPPGKK
jgi:putative membrane-bound dehydrogenase-like protein